MHQYVGCTNQRLLALPSEKQWLCASRAFQRAVPLQAGDNRRWTFFFPDDCGVPGEEYLTLMLADRAPFVAASLTPLERLAQRQAALIYGGSGCNYKASRMTKRGRCGGVHRPTLLHGWPRRSWSWPGYQEVRTAIAVLGVGVLWPTASRNLGLCAVSYRLFLSFE